MRVPDEEAVSRMRRVRRSVAILLAVVVAAWLAPASHVSAALGVVESIRFNGSDDSFANTPASSINAVTGDLDLRAEIAPDRWTGTQKMGILSKLGTTWTDQMSYIFVLTGDGHLAFSWSTDGTTPRHAHSTSPMAAAADAQAGSARWVRVTLTANNGVGGTDIRFFESIDGVTWAAVGPMQRFGGTTSLYQSSRPIAFGNDGLQVDPFLGRLYDAQVRRGIDGPVVAQLKAAALNPADPSRSTDSAGNVWTVRGSNWSVDRAAPASTSGPVTAVRFRGGVADTLRAATPGFDAPGLDVRVKVAPSAWAQPATLVSKAGVGRPNAAISYALSTTSAGALRLSWNDGTVTQRSATSTVPIPVPGSTATWVRSTLAPAGATSTEVRFTYSSDGVNWTAVGAPVPLPIAARVVASQQPVFIASLGGWNEFLVGAVSAVQVRSSASGPVLTGFDAATTSSAAPGSTLDVSGARWLLRGPTWTLDMAPSVRRFFNSTASWNQPATAYATDARSAMWAQRLWTYMGGFNSTPNGNVSVKFVDFSVPIYDRREPGTYLRQVFTRTFDQPQLSTTGVAPGDWVPWNSAWRPSPERGWAEDRQMIVVDQVTGEFWEYWAVYDCFTDVRKLCAGLVNRGPSGSVKDIFAASDADGSVAVTRGNGTNKAIGVARAVEVAEAVRLNRGLLHALEITLPNTMFGTQCPSNASSGDGSLCSFYVAPATKVEHPGGPGCANVTNDIATRLKTVPSGLRFSLTITDAQIDAWLATKSGSKWSDAKKQTARVFARTMRDYGAIVSETTCGQAAMETDGINPGTRDLWKQLGIDETTPGYQPGFPHNDLLDGLITSSNIRVLKPPR